MRVTVIELPATWGDPDGALAVADGILALEPAGDLVLLPETSLTGYVSPDLDFDLTPFAEPADGPTTRALSDLAKKHRTHLFGPLILEERGNYYNATVGFDPEGRHIVTYRKRHPWYPEQDWATAGPDPHPLFEVCGLTVTIACCFDIHFLADEATDTLDRADLLLFPSSWVEEVNTRPRRLRALAKKHHLSIAAANWGRGPLFVKGQGGSAILDATGNELARVTTTHRADATIG